ncbi:MAG: FHA domain-containing protein [Thermosynechococcaceae cyanobacterium]
MSVSTTYSPKQRKQIAPERHVIVIDDGNRRAISLDAAAYAMGRDASNAIVLNSTTISRKHAMLLRLPIPGENRYRYRLIDGDAAGKPSANGIFVNEQRCSSHELVNGDTLSFGRKIRASYLTVTMEEAEFTKYLESIEFHSLKSERVNSKATLVHGADTDPTEKQPQRPPTVLQQAGPDAKGTVFEAVDISELVSADPGWKEWLSRYRLGIITASVLATVGLGVCLTIARTNSQPKKSAVLINASRTV